MTAMFANMAGIDAPSRAARAAMVATMAGEGRA